MSSFAAHHLTQGALLERLARERGDHEALVYPDRGLRVTFADLEARSLALARGLIAIGIEPGERVTIWSENRPDWIPLQFALARIGAVLVTANTALTQAEIGYLLRQSRSSAVIAAPGKGDGNEYRDALTSLRAGGELPALRRWISLEPEPRSSEPAPPDGAVGIDELVARGADVPAREVHARTAETHVEDPTNIQYTSGTTGFPKGVVLTHRNIVENGYAVAQAIGASEVDRILLQVPLFHCFGCVVTVLGGYTHGATLIACESFDPLGSLEAIAAERCTVINGVPAMFLAMLSHPEFERLRPSTLRRGVMAGAPCPEPLMHRVVAQMRCPGMLVAYGLTEASPGVTCSHPDDPVDVRCSTAGRALPGVAIRIVDPATGVDLPDGERGELWAKGPNIMQGYFDDPDATAEAIVEGGWLRTGDLATRDAGGLVRIVGRIKEMIIRGGENVYPSEVENALRSHAAVRDAAVFGVPDEKFGEAVAAAIVLAPGATLTEAALCAHLEDRIAPFKRPTRIAFVQGFPMTASGKVQKFRLAEHCGFGG